MKRKINPSKRYLLRRIKAIEADTYPDFMCQMGDITSWADLQDYCESQEVHVSLIEPNGYVIYTPQEVVDLIGSGNLFKILTELKSFYQSKPFKVDLRYSTIWPIIERLSKRGSLIIMAQSFWYWESEMMIEAILQFKKRRI